MRRRDLINLIEKAGRVPVERDTPYREVIRSVTEDAFTIAV